MDKRRLVLATQNLDKVKELSEILGGEAWELLSLRDFAPDLEIEEDGDTLFENALIKARTTFQITKLPSVADDTGLDVDALDGAPGVRSSRFAGVNTGYQQNIIKLLQVMKGIPEERRTAQFRCVAAYADGLIERTVEGVCKGTILNEQRGSNGFGYDPVFYITELKKTFAEMDPAEKNTISHRGIAFRKMAEFLQSH
jgi:XTP/dITP diphosphohydrolase